MDPRNRNATEAIQLLRQFSVYLDTSLNIKHKQKIQSHLNAGLIAGRKTSDLKTGQIDRIFDNLQKEQLTTIMEVKENERILKGIIEEKHDKVRMKALNEFITKLTKKSKAIILTEEGAIRPEMLAFLDQYTLPDPDSPRETKDKTLKGEFSKRYKRLSLDDQEKLKSSLIFSLAHAMVMTTMLGVAETITLDDQEKMTQALSRVAEEINHAQKTLKTEDVLRAELSAFINNCIQSNQLDMNAEAKRIAQAFKLGIKFNSKNKISLQDQLLKFIGQNRPDIVKEITHFQKGLYENRPEAVKREKVINVLNKTGVSHAAIEFKAFVTAIDHVRAEEQALPLKSPRFPS